MEPPGDYINDPYIEVTQSDPAERLNKYLDKFA